MVMAINAVSSTLSYNFILKNYYSKNRAAVRETTRKSIDSKSLMTADSDALSKIAKTLRDLEYSTDNGVGIYNNIKAFVETYNNLTESTSGYDLYNITRPGKLLKNLIKKNKDELEDIGVNVSTSGKLSVDKEKLLETTPEKLANIFSSKSEFTKNVRFYAGKIYKASGSVNILMPDTISNTGNTAGTQSIPGVPSSIFDARA